MKIYIRLTLIILTINFINHLTGGSEILAAPMSENGVWLSSLQQHLTSNILHYRLDAADNNDDGEGNDDGGGNDDDTGNDDGGGNDDDSSGDVTVEAVSIEGLTEGVVEKEYTFTATASPANAALPVTFTWQATGQATVTHIVTDTSDTISFIWPTTGPKTINVTATNVEKTVFATHLITLSQGDDGSSSDVALEDVFIDGPTIGAMQTDHNFTATVSPSSTTLPVTFT